MPFAYSSVSLWPLIEVGVADPRRLERAVLEVAGGRVVDRAADLPAEREDAVVEVQVLAHVARGRVQTSDEPPTFSGVTTVCRSPAPATGCGLADCQ